MNTERAESLGINPVISLKEGIKSKIKWYNQYGNNNKIIKYRYFRKYYYKL